MDKRKNKRSVQISDVAKLAGVSPATVSVVVNNRIGQNIRVSPETAERVRNAVKQLGYIASPIARKLAGADSQLLGLFTYEPIFPFKSRNFYFPFLIGVEEEAEEQGFDLLLFTSSGHQSGFRSVYKDGINRLQLADGAIFMGLSEDKEELMDLLDEGFPFVFIGRRELPRGELSYIAADYTKATQNLVQHLSSLGHKKMAYLDSLEGREVHIDRQKGYDTGLRQVGIQRSNDDYYQVQNYTITAEHLQSWLDKGTTAFLAENNILGMSLLDASNKLGKGVPLDFSVALLGDPIEPSEEPVNWTMFKIPRREMGREAVRLLIKLLQDDADEPIQEMLECTFVQGQTVSHPPDIALD